MSLNKNKVLATAQKLTAKGQLDRAIAEYCKITDVEPENHGAWLKIGDLFMRKGDREEATRTYLKVAGQYVDQGFQKKAIAVLSQVLSLQPQLIDAHLILFAHFIINSVDWQNLNWPNAVDQVTHILDWKCIIQSHA